LHLKIWLFHTDTSYTPRVSNSKLYTGHIEKENAADHRLK
jgi:hypothetical protein